jgi:hypothetical protein
VNDDGKLLAEFEAEAPEPLPAKPSLASLFLYENARSNLVKFPQKALHLFWFFPSMQNPKPTK